MAFLSAIQVAFDKGEELAGAEIGFLGYGSGSKSKVFAGKISKNWKTAAAKWNLFENLKNRTAVDFETYEKLHRKQLQTSVNKNYKGFGLTSVETDNPVLKGARYYHYKD
jgi:hydroxymethylglutaryl-CoA synthase